MRFSPLILVLAVGLGSFASRNALADTSFTLAFDDNGFTSPLNPYPPFVGIGTLTLVGSVGDGTYTLDSLPGLTLSLAFADGDTYTQADILSDPSQAEVVVYNNGANAYFSDMTPDAYTGGSLTLINSAGDVLSFSPSYYPAGFFVEEGFFGIFGGNYGPPVPEPSSLSLACVAALTGGIAGVVRKRDKAKTGAGI